MLIFPEHFSTSRNHFQTRSWNLSLLTSARLEWRLPRPRGQPDWAHRVGAARSSTRSSTEDSSVLIPFECSLGRFLETENDFGRMNEYIMMEIIRNHWKNKWFWCLHICCLVSCLFNYHSFQSMIKQKTFDFHILLQSYEHPMRSRVVTGGLPM